MPIRSITPNRAWLMVATAAFVTAFNILVSTNNDFNGSSVEDYYFERLLSGPLPQDDPSLLSWVRKNIHPPSKHPYNFTFKMSGIVVEKKYMETIFSPSQEFILSKVEEILGKDIEKGGTFLEAGAYDGNFLSNTLSLEYTWGWNGILVEPHPEFFKELLAKHRKSYAINACLSTKPYPVRELFVSRKGDNTTNHVYNSKNNDAESERHVNMASSGLAKFRREESVMSDIQDQFLVQCIPLFSILKALDMTHIDFFSLDVEKAEMEILDTIPWGQVSFSILAIEHDTLPDLRSYLRPKGYIHVDSNLQDHIFISRNLSNLRYKNPAPSNT